MQTTGFTLRTKLIAGYVVIIALTLGLGVFAIMMLERVNGMSTEIEVNWMPSIFYTSDINTATSDYRIAEFQHILSLTVTEMQQFETVMQDRLDYIKKRQEQYEPLISSDTEQKLYDQFVTEFDAYLEEHAHIIALSNENRAEEAKARIRGKSQELFDSFSATLMKLVELNFQGGTQSSQEGDLLYARSRWFIIGALALAAGCAIIIAIALTRSILAQLGADPAVVAAIAKQVAAGNLDARFDTQNKQAKGLLGDLHAMAANLREIVTNVQISASNVTDGSQQISSSAEEMSQGASEQAASAEEVSSSMEEMVANITQNAENALQTEKIAVKAAADAQDSGQAVAATVTAMRDIVQRITVVEEIARQTHTLSLNATIEAAKAEEYGKGFAVVAAEVRTLASRAQTSATEINHVASQSIAAAEKAGEMLNKLVPDIRKTAELVQEINAASREQRTTAEQINKAVQQLDSVIQQNSAVSEEMASTSEELAAQAEHLQGAIAYFRTGEEREQQAEESESGRKPTRASLNSRTASLKQRAARTANQSGSHGAAPLHPTPPAAARDDVDNEFEHF